MKYDIITNILPEATELQRLFIQTSWAKNRSIQDIKLMLGYTRNYVLVRHNSCLIGFGRVLSDGIYRALLDDIVVDINYRKQGIGNQIVKELLRQLPNVEQVFLNTKPELEGFYNAHGFSKSKVLTMSL